MTIGNSASPQIWLTKVSAPTMCLRQLHKLREHDAVVQYHEYRAGLQVSYSGYQAV